MSVSNNKIGVLINMEKDLKESLMALAKKENRSLTNYINTILKNHIDNIKKNKSIHS